MKALFREDRQASMKDEMNKQLAIIRSAGLEIKERGILNFWINVNYEEGYSQGIGGIALDSYDEEKARRIGTAYGCEMIRRVLLALDVNDFSEMKGKIIWVIGKNKGLSFKPKGIQQLAINGGGDAVIFDDIAAEFGLREE
ncbi:MAG: hypothetical protein EOM59_17765 [Clostridia bacterium]|nr:hypothetical protein [Clostridia bacterium]